MLCACGVQPSPSVAPEVAGEGRVAGVTTDILVRPRARPEGFEIAAAPKTVEPAVEPNATNGSLGMTVASLGNPAEDGLWLKTPLVASETIGRVVYPATGKTVSVTLIPLDGPPTAGSQLSLSAMQGLGAGLADLPTVEVFL